MSGDGRWWQPNATDHTCFIKGCEAHTLAVVVLFCDDRGRAVHPKLHTGLLQVLPHLPTQPRNVGCQKTTPVVGAIRHNRARGRNPPDFRNNRSKSWNKYAKTSTPGRNFTPLKEQGLHVYEIQKVQAQYIRR
ncbi:hypothetical protein MTP99_001486 [Tenebrio molitor]|nr:hypothetical protein MTP99_001486 [Tenebrio molitor]